tara:strand:+ start:728 stop:949 length:222 start_codon:yes stop_codon:yes gene_type:complete
MEITRELNLQTFVFWMGAKEHCFTYSELGEIESQLDDFYPNGTTETNINDLFWFEEEFICECLGLNYDEYLER